MQKLSLADCYGHAGLSADSVNIAQRMEPFQSIVENLTKAQTLDAIRHYFDLPVRAETDWFSIPFTEVDPSFSMLANKREVGIISMALIAHQIFEESDEFAALAFLVANACGKREPVLYPQFGKTVEAAALDLSVSQEMELSKKQVQGKLPNKGSNDEDWDVPINDGPALNAAFRKLETESLNFQKRLMRHINSVVAPIRGEVEALREETDMLWWLVGGEGHLAKEPYFQMKGSRAAFAIGVDLAALSRTCLGPRASEFLMKKALREGRKAKLLKTTIECLPECFTLDELKLVASAGPIDELRDLCSLNNALMRATQVGELKSAWCKMYADDGSLDIQLELEPDELALQSFREALLLNSYI